MSSPSAQRAPTVLLEALDLALETLLSHYAPVERAWAAVEAIYAFHSPLDLTPHILPASVAQLWFWEDMTMHFQDLRDLLSRRMQAIQDTGAVTGGIDGVPASIIEAVPSVSLPAGSQAAIDYARRQRILQDLRNRMNTAGQLFTRSERWSRIVSRCRTAVTTELNRPSQAEEDAQLMIERMRALHILEERAQMEEAPTAATPAARTDTASPTSSRFSMSDSSILTRPRRYTSYDDQRAEPPRRRSSNITSSSSVQNTTANSTARHHSRRRVSETLRDNGISPPRLLVANNLRPVRNEPNPFGPTRVSYEQEPWIGDDDRHRIQAIMAETREEVAQEDERIRLEELSRHRRLEDSQREQGGNNEF